MIDLDIFERKGYELRKESDERIYCRFFDLL